MKYTITVFCFLAAACALFGQKAIVCKSGQVIQVDGASNFVSSNIDELIQQKSGSAPEVLNLYKTLLEKEKKNRLELVKLERLTAILEYDLERAEKDKKDTYKLKLQTARKDINICNKQYESISDDIVACLEGKAIKPKAVEVVAVQQSDPVNTQPQLEQAEVVRQEDQPKMEPPIQAESRVAAEQVTESKGKKTETIKVTEDANCSLQFKGRDAVSNKKQVILNPATLLTYTPDKMKNYFKTRDFMTLKLGLEKLDGEYFFNVEVNFNSRDVMRSYGVIHKTDFLRLEFISGKKIFLKVVEVTEPYLEKQTGNTIYKVRYTLNNRQDAGLLKKEYLNSLGIMWSSGFEAYPVYDVDFFHRQIQCLNKE